ncbi:hypothetical protein D3C84_946270 [compost metagenome]
MMGNDKEKALAVPAPWLPQQLQGEQVRFAALVTPLSTSRVQGPLMTWPLAGGVMGILNELGFSRKVVLFPE